MADVVLFVIPKTSSEKGIFFNRWRKNFLPAQKEKLHNVCAPPVRIAMTKLTLMRFLFFKNIITDGIHTTPRGLPLWEHQDR